MAIRFGNQCIKQLGRVVSVAWTQLCVLDLTADGCKTFWEIYFYSAIKRVESYYT
jgi:hypothetical protein